MKNNREKLEGYQEWVQYAQEDQRMVEIAIKEKGPANQICFHAQQMAEKYLKAFLIFSRRRFEKRHQLDYLLHLCEKIDSSFRQLTNPIKYLADFYVETRYPGEIPQFTFSECQRAFREALRVRDFVFKKISKGS